MTIDRVELNRALAKCVAYKQCGKHGLSAAWAVELMRLLDCADIIETTTAARFAALLEHQEG